MIRHKYTQLVEETYPPFFQPIEAWAPVVGLFVITALGSFVGLGSVLRLLFPVGAIAVGIFLYSRYPLLYIGFNWWLWFLTPFLRRLADYHSRFDPMGLMLTAPYLASSVAILSIIQHLPKARRQNTLPFAFVLVAIGYSFLVGFLNNALVVVMRTLLDWLPPVIFGFYLSLQWRDYPQIRNHIQRVFVWGALVMGTYGVWQYLVAPQWDRFWLDNVAMVSFGKPEPRGIRVWSTVNSPVSFGSVMLTSLILLLSSKHKLSVLGSTVGYLSFLLSLVRAAWGGWIIAVLILISSVKQSIQIRLITTFLTMALCIIPLVTIDPFSNIISSRIGTLTNVQQDSSFEDRSETYAQNFNAALSQPLGRGLGGTWYEGEGGQAVRVAFDSGILDIFFTLGWIGTIPYLVGMVLLLMIQFSGEESLFDPFANAARAITSSHFLMLLLGSFMTGTPGFIFWSFLGLGLAAHKHYLSQKQKVFSEFRTDETVANQ